MKTKVFETKQFVERIYCDCGNELVAYNGFLSENIKYEGGIPSYRHICGSCKNEYWLKQQYPVFFIRNEMNVA